MPQYGISKLCTDNEFASMFEELGASALANKLGVDVRSVYNRRVNVEKKLRRQLTSPDRYRNYGETRNGIKHPDWAEITVNNGVVLVGSDCHYWPGEPSTAHKAFVMFCKELRPAAVVMNGDVLDGATVSRHPPIGWERTPTLQEEIEACDERLGEIEQAAGKAKKIWTLGNHDQRFETRIATVVPEFAKIKGVHLKDHFPLWEPAWACIVNNSVVIKHRYKGGIHATHNNAVQSGKSMVTGHLHSLKVTPWTDYNGTRFGVDGGCISDPFGPQFESYTEQNPVNWRSGFAVLTFENGTLRWPEVVHVLDKGVVEFRGKSIKV